MKKLIIKEVQDFNKIKARCGYTIELDYDTIEQNIVTGKVIIKLPNGENFYRSMQWDQNGSSIGKDKFPSLYYYDLKIVGEHT